MLEIFGSIAMSEVGKFVLEKGLELGQAAAEDYVKDFFKDALKGELGAKPEVAKKAVGEALKAFFELMEDELADRDVSEAVVRDLYQNPLMAFVKDDTVKPILGGAFERDCRSIDTVTLANVWARSEFKKKPFPEMPEGFDWERIGKEYLKKVRKIVRSSDELRSLLQTELLEAIASQQVSPGFEFEKYRESLRCSYGVLKLSTIDSTDQQYRMRLWNVFVEQSVREALPPSRYELPIDVRREVGMTGDLDGEALEGYRREYLQQPARKVLEAIGEKGCGVILGDPGAGKSTVLQYLAIEWAEGREAVLPLLIELREYALWGASGFLEFLHGGRGADWCFDRVKMDGYLREFPTVVMLDGLDEVFDRSMQAAIVDEMIRFSHQYPKVRILVTSRIVGYNPDRLQNAGFRHFTIQSLEPDEIHEFIDKWYDLAMPGDDDRDRLKQRLKDAIANSKAIGNLADNLLLLTMMVILNRRQELPRDRSELYEQATRVLLHHWDVDHKSLQLPIEAIGRREKQAMLRCVAYEMQTSESGLKGNLITADRLTQVLTGYLREQGFEAPREKANGLIEQLRSRNWILCDRGADTYGFVHRTFLEYFCAMEIVHRFEKTRELTFEKLRDEVFGNHWQDETWHEVLRLICGAIDPHFSDDLIVYLICIEVDKKPFLDYRLEEARLDVKGLENLLIAADCLSEITHSLEISQTTNFLLDRLKDEIENPKIRLTYSAAIGLLNCILQISPESFNWVEDQILNTESSVTRSAALNAIVKNINHDKVTFDWLKNILSNGKDWAIRRASVYAISLNYPASNDILELLKEFAQLDEHPSVRWASMVSIEKYYSIDSTIFNLIQHIAKLDPFTRFYSYSDNPRKLAVEILLRYDSTHPKTIELLHDRALNDPDEQLREWAIEQLKKLEGSD